MLLALRALFWTLALPGVFGFYLPWTLFDLGSVEIDASNPRDLQLGPGTLDQFHQGNN